MLRVKNTPNLTGVLIIGDTEDFENLYDALHKVVGIEDTMNDHYEARLRVLNFCYNIRHARMGNRNAFFKPHGLEEEQMAYMSLVGSKQNLYVSFETLWPELLFNVFAFEDFISMYIKREKAHAWDANVLTVRKFQSLIAHLLEETLTPRQFSSLKKSMNPTSKQFKGFTTQYIDLLNHEWLDMTREKRLKNLSIYAKKITQPDIEYEIVKEDVAAVAKEHYCHPSEIKFNFDFPDKIEW